MERNAKPLESQHTTSDAPRGHHLARFVNGVAALPKTTELPVLDYAHPAHDPPAAVPALGIGAAASALVRGELSSTTVLTYAAVSERDTESVSR